MADFAYTAKSLNGEKRSGSLVADSKADAMQKLRAQSLYPISVTGKQTAKPRVSFVLPKRIKKEQVADLCSQLSDLLSNGVPMLESIQILAEATENPRLKESVLRIHEAVSQGDTLDVAMSKETGVFSELTLSMIRAGQEGAFLEEALQRTSHFLRKQDEMRSKIVGALTYPAILGFVGTAIVSLMVVFLVPKFQPLFDRLEQTGSALPTVTVILLGASQVMSAYGVMVLAAFAAVAYGVFRWTNTTAGRRFTDQLKLRLPLLGSIFHDSAVSRTCRVLGTMLHNGVPLLRALKISSESTGNVLLADAILRSAENVTSGDSLSKPLLASGLIPAQVVLIGCMVMFVIVGVLMPVLDLNSSVG